MVDDAELLRRYAEEKSEAAFADLVQRHLDLVYSAALRRLAGDAHAAADVTQQVFVALARRARSLAQGVVLPAWLYATTRNVAVDFIRAERRRRAREQEAHTMHELESNPPPAGDWERLRPLLDEVMDDLSERDREAVLLRFFARRSFAEIGAALRLSEDAARMRVERALDKLQVLLSRRGVSSTTAAFAAALTEQAVTAAPAGMAAAVTGSAVTAGGTAVGPLLGLIQFMSTTKIATGIAMLALVLMFTATLVEVRAGREATAQSATQARAVDANRMLSNELQGRIAVTEQETAGLQRTLTEIREAKSVEAARPGVVPTAETPGAMIAAGEAFMAKYPEVRQALIAFARARMAGRFLPLYETLGFNSAQIEEFENLMISGQPATTVKLRGLAPMTMMITATPPSERQERWAALFGEAGAKQFAEYGRLEPSRRFTEQVAASLYFTSTPLTADQAEQLTRIIAENRTGPAGNTRFDWNAIRTKAESILTGPQLEPLRGFDAQREYTLALNEAMGRASPPAPSSPAR